MTTIPSRLSCELADHVTRCPNVECPERLHGGRLCGRVVEDLMRAHDDGHSWGLERTQANVAWALGVDVSRVGQIERGALLKLRRELTRRDRSLSVADWLGSSESEAA